MSFDHAASRVALLETDPDLGLGLSGPEFELASRRAVATVLDVERPAWDPGRLRQDAGPGWLGLLVIDGLMLRCVTVGKRTACELFGPGDVVRPWDADGEYGPLVIRVGWRVPESAKLALLDTAFAKRIAPWPSIAAQLVSRAARRARFLALTQAVNHLPRIHARLLILFWLLAERWGRVTADGVRIELPLTHDVLAMLVGAQRPSVTVALRRLRAGGMLNRPKPKHWLLTNEAIESLHAPESLNLIDTAPLGETSPADA